MIVDNFLSYLESSSFQEEMINQALSRSGGDIWGEEELDRIKIQEKKLLLKARN